MWFTKAEMLLWPFNAVLGFTGSSATRWTSWTESKVREDSKLTSIMNGASHLSQRSTAKAGDRPPEEERGR